MASWSKRLVMGLLRLYKSVVSPWMGNACRYVPTCSEYAMQAVERHGVVRGSFMAFWRLLRCHPFASGGHDPVSHMNRRGSDNFAAARTE